MQPLYNVYHFILSVGRGREALNTVDIEHVYHKEGRPRNEEESGHNEKRECGLALFTNSLLEVPVL